MVVESVTGCHAEEGEEEEEDGEAVEHLGGEVEAEHRVHCPEAEEGEELNIVLEGQFEQNQPEGIWSDELADLVVEQQVEQFIDQEHHGYCEGY